MAIRRAVRLTVRLMKFSNQPDKIVSPVKWKYPFFASLARRSISGRKGQKIQGFVYLCPSCVELLSRIHGAKLSWIFQIRRKFWDWHLYLSLINSGCPESSASWLTLDSSNPSQNLQKQGKRKRLRISRKLKAEEPRGLNNVLRMSVTSLVCQRRRN